MRARFAILLAGQAVKLRAITMVNKPPHMLTMSPKGTVPVLILENGVDVLDESLDIMLWALNLNDPDNLLYSQNPDCLKDMLAIIEENDKQFKPTLERYKRAKRYHKDDEEHCRQLCDPFIQQLEARLTRQEFLMGSTPSLLDYALLPFVRQFSKVNRQTYLQGPYTHLQKWLNRHLQSLIYSKTMFKYPLWLDDYQECIFGEKM